MAEIKHQPCPDQQNCGSSDAFCWNTEKLVGHCHSCKTGFSEFKGVLYATTPSGSKAIRNMVEDPFDLIENVQKTNKIPVAHKGTVGVFKDFRGIKASVREFYGSLYYENPDRVVYPYPNGGTKTRYIEDKTFSVSNLKSDELFGMNLFPVGSSKMVTITEGEEDAMAAYQMLSSGNSFINPVVSLPSATPNKRIWEKCFKWLDGFEKIILSLDSDGKGDHIKETLFDLFPHKIYVMDHGGVKDANDFLLQGKQKAYKDAWWKAKEYSPAGFVADAESWIEVLETETPYEYVETPIQAFNKVGRGLVKGGITVVKAPPGTGKCLGKDTPVLMWDGSVKMAQDVIVGDLLMGDDSTSRKVLGTTSGVDQLYRIVPNKGESWVCNSQHVLSLYHNTKKKVFDIGLQDYLVEKSDFTHHAKQYRAKVTYFEADVVLPIDPYLYGVFLGDGAKTEAVLTLGHKKDKVREVVKQKITDMGLDYKETFVSAKNCYSIRISNGHKPHPFLRIDVDLVEDYKRASWEDRRQFLAGLLDTDGFSYVGGFDFVQKDKRIADAVVFVARSLGLAAYIKPCEKSIKSVGFTGEYYRVGISGDTRVIPTLRHSQAARKINKNVLNTGFQVEELGLGEYFGFELDGNHRFLLGDFTVTHNSSLLRMLQHDLVVNHGKTVAVLMMEEMKSTTGRAMATYQLGKNVMTREDAERRNVSEESVKQALLEVVGDRKFISFDINPQNAVEDCLKQCKYAEAFFGAEYIFIDHLQRLAYLGGTEGATAALTELGVKLTEFAKRKNLGIICISHVNQDGKTKYASSIEEEAICIIELERDKFSEDAIEQNTTYITVGKNRPFALTGAAGMVMYDAESTMVSERVAAGTVDPSVDVFEVPTRERVTDDDIPF